MRIQLEIPAKTAERVKAIMQETETKTYSELFAYALSALDWMVKTRKEDLLVVATDRKFTRPMELSMPILDRIAIDAPVPVPVQTPEKPKAAAEAEVPAPVAAQRRK